MQTLDAYAECHSIVVMCRYAKCSYAPCRFDECGYAEWRSGEYCYAECLYDECHYAECCGAIVRCRECSSGSLCSHITFLSKLINWPNKLQGLS